MKDKKIYIILLNLLLLISIFHNASINSKSSHYVNQPKHFHQLIFCCLDNTDTNLRCDYDSTIRRIMSMGDGLNINNSRTRTSGENIRTRFHKDFDYNFTKIKHNILNQQRAHFSIPLKNVLMREKYDNCLLIIICKLSL